MIMDTTMDTIMEGTMNTIDVTVDQVSRFVALGGGVMVALIVLGVAMWSALLFRWLERQLGWRGPLDALVDSPPTDHPGVLPKAAARAAQLVLAKEPIWRLNIHFDEVRHRLSRGRSSAQAMILAAPLLGLLGTITGMIDTFEVLEIGQRAGYSQAMARGISKALITTEFGLLLSIPGILVSRALDRREARIERALDELESRFVARLSGES